MLFLWRWGGGPVGGIGGASGQGNTRRGQQPAPQASPFTAPPPPAPTRAGPVPAPEHPVLSRCSAHIPNRMEEPRLQQKRWFAVEIWRVPVWRVSTRLLTIPQRSVENSVGPISPTPSLHLSPLGVYIYSTNVS